MSWRAVSVVGVLMLTAFVTWLGSLHLPARSAQVDAAQFRAACPPTVAAAAFKPDQVPNGWVGAIPQDARLTGAGLLWGPPNESGYLKPDETRTTGPAARRVNITRWRLEVPHSYETWMYCKYGSLQLSKRVPPESIECTASSTGNSNVLDEIEFICK
jgi:hypothetical protein